MHNTSLDSHPSQNTQTVINLNCSTVADFEFYKCVEGKKYSFLRKEKLDREKYDSVYSIIDKISPCGEIQNIHTVEGLKTYVSFLKIDENIVSLQYDTKDGDFNVAIYSDQQGIPTGLGNTIFGLLELENDVVDKGILVKLWSYDRSFDNGTYIGRKLEAPTWDEIKLNYSEPTRKELQLLVENFEKREGKLTILNGEPGTGKTTFIRSLFRESNKFAVCNYITDPQNFFGEQTNYLLSVTIVDQDDEITSNDSISEIDTENKKLIIVLEDCGELIKSDSKMEFGSGLSRFLNVIDGIIGQGLNIGVILSTNEKIKDFHPAIVRAGRINTIIEFGALSVEESKEWCNKEGINSDQIDSPKTIAELYNILKLSDPSKSGSVSDTIITKKRNVGFA